MTRFQVLEMAHTACPNKTDIYAPKFELVEQVELNSGAVALHVYRCMACSTRVIVKAPESA